jgi:hypothetical protein
MGNVSGACSRFDAPGWGSCCCGCSATRSWSDRPC